MKVTRRSAGLLLLLYAALAGVWVWRLAPATVALPVQEDVDRQAKIAAYLAKAPQDPACPLYPS
ncbi:MAG TPA: hypothetical protein DCP71_14425, partial [Verrucomicrobiales bacterium]|nr:hypothetical protein [Verrucomicrobiales bacterium]